MAEIRILEWDDVAQEAVLEVTTTIPTEDKQLFSRINDYTFSLISFGECISHTVYDGRVSLSGFLVSNITFEDYLCPPLKTDESFFSYHLYAKVQNARERHVRFGDIDIFLDMPLPKDIRDRDLVSFDVMRLDFAM